MISLEKRNAIKNRPVLGLLAGLGIGLVVGAIMALIVALLNTELLILDIAGLWFVGFIMSKFLPHKSTMGAVSGALACGVTYLFYLFIVSACGLYWEDGDIFDAETLNILFTIGAFIYGGIMGYLGQEGLEDDKQQGEQ